MIYPRIPTEEGAERLALDVIYDRLNREEVEKIAQKCEEGGRAYCSSYLHCYIYNTGSSGHLPAIWPICAAQIMREVVRIEAMVAKKQ